MGLLKIGALPPERSGNDIGFAIGIDVANGSTFGQILIRQLDLLKKDRCLRGGSLSPAEGGEKREQ